LASWGKRSAGAPECEVVKGWGGVDPLLSTPEKKENHGGGEGTGNVP